MSSECWPVHRGKHLRLRMPPNLPKSNPFTSFTFVDVTPVLHLSWPMTPAALHSCRRLVFGGRRLGESGDLGSLGAAGRSGESVVGQAMFYKKLITTKLKGLKVFFLPCSPWCKSEGQALKKDCPSRKRQALKAFVAFGGQHFVDVNSPILFGMWLAAPSYPAYHSSIFNTGPWSGGGSVFKWTSACHLRHSTTLIKMEMAYWVCWAIWKEWRIPDLECLEKRR